MGVHVMCNFPKRLERYHLEAVAVILIVSGVLKLFSLTDALPLFSQRDQFLLIPTGKVMFLAAIMEMLVAVLLLSPSGASGKHVILMWMGASFLTYRLLADSPCQCLGNVMQRIGVSPRNENVLIYMLDLWFLLPSLTFVLLRYLPRPILSKAS